MFEVESFSPVFVSFKYYLELHSFKDSRLNESNNFNNIVFRAIRRQSLSEIGFGRLDTYTKLDKLGEVSFSLNTLIFTSSFLHVNKH